eukprot:CAMPEP_0113464790 /NCGR_PEP_ID=MMETSP0014_2-20120614/13386_1 /TAXON_ID=2857 /ORGANISM="Nitzschia sp." /LENGTH=299 /DNA_ID=CAMNT_0000356889 /DNA_START=354 /DNA_END=1254 /DNA_ORIENTATION=- /assembly_acc=CAM_ASM_000159
MQKNDEKGKDGLGPSTGTSAINGDNIMVATGVAWPLSEIPLEIENGEEEEEEQIARDCRLGSGSEPRHQQQQQEMMPAAQIQKESMMWPKVVVVLLLVAIVIVVSIGLIKRSNDGGSTQHQQPRLPDEWVTNSCYEECYEYWYKYPDGTTRDIDYRECCGFWEEYYNYYGDDYYDHDFNNNDYGEDYYDQDYGVDLEPYNLAAEICNVPPYMQMKDLLSVGDVVPGHPNSFWYNDLFPCRFSNRPCDVGINDGEYEVMNLGPDLQTIKISLTGDVQAGEVWMVATDPNGQPVTVTRDSH